MCGDGRNLSAAGSRKAQTSADAGAMERLRSQMTTALAAARQGNQARLKEIGRIWIIPDYELWFRAMFEEGTGATMASAYGANIEPTEKLLPKLFEWLAQQEGELVIEDAKTLPKRSDSWCGEKLESLLKGDLALYRVSVGKADSSGLQSGRVAGYFALVAGEYRRLDCPSLGLGQPPSSEPQPHRLTGPLRVGGNVQGRESLRGSCRSIRTKRGWHTFRERCGFTRSSARTARSNSWSSSPAIPP
jgi:hypothetical protein